MRTHHGLINGVCGLVRKDASGKARDNLGHTLLKACSKDVVRHQHVVTEEVKVG